MKRAMLFNVSSVLLGIIATYVTMPLSLRLLGEERYGVWLLLLSALAFVPLIQLGLPLSVSRQLAASLGRGDTNMRDETARVSTVFVCLSLLALAAGLASLTLLADGMEIPSASLRQFLVAAPVAVCTIAIGIVGQVPAAVLLAYEEHAWRSGVLSAGHLIRLLATVGALMWSASLPALALAQLGAELVTGTAMAAVASLRCGYRPWRLRIPTAQWLRELYSFSVVVFLFNLGSQLSVQANNLVIGQRLGADLIPQFSVSNAILTAAQSLTIAVSAVLLPRITRMFASGDAQGAGDLVRKVYSQAVILVAGFVLCVRAFAGPFFAWWLNPDFAERATPVFLVLAWSMFFFLPARGVLVPTVMAKGRPLAMTLVWLLLSSLGLLSSWVLAPRLGIAAVAWSAAVAYTTFALTLAYLIDRAAIARLSTGLPLLLSKVGILVMLAAVLRVFFEPASMTGALSDWLVDAVLFCSSLMLASVMLAAPADVRRYITRLASIAR